jgi:hypothetical protein
MVHAQLDLKHIWILYIFLVYFISNELYTIFKDYKGSYFSDVWNLLDMLFIILLGSYIVTHHFGVEK